MSNTNSATNTDITSSATTATARVGPGGTTGSQACAACRYQRRRCSPDCLLAPHFPANLQNQFLNAHKLFGVGKILKLLKTVRPSDQDAAAKSMIIHANLRAHDPVGGCHRLILELQRQIDHGTAELELVRRELAVCRAQAAQQLPLQNPSDLDVNVDPQLVYNPMYLQALDCSRRFHPVQDQELVYVDSSNSCYVPFGSKVDVEARSSSSSMAINGKQLFVDESEDIKPFFGIFDEKLPVPFDSKDSNESRCKIVQKEVESIHQKQEDDLKGAASLFSLTNSSNSFRSTT